MSWVTIHYQISVVQVFLPLFFLWLSQPFAEERFCFNEAELSVISFVDCALAVVSKKSWPNLFLHVAYFSHHGPYHINHICLDFLV